MKPEENKPAEKEQFFDVELLADYWPTEAELKLNPDTDAAKLPPVPAPGYDGPDIVVEPRFKAGMKVKLALKSAFKLVEEGKAKRADWGD